VAYFLCACLLVACLLDDRPDTQAVLKLAAEMAEATKAGQYGKVLDRTYPGIIKMMGGRDQALKVTQDAMDRIKAQGISIETFTTGKPGPYETEGEHTFIVVPTELVLKLPTGRMKLKSYLLGISPDGGKTWTFADGNGLQNESVRDKVLPKLPANLKLPAPQQPEMLK
jgi:hypothetical protein